MSQYGYRKSKASILESPEQFTLEEEIKIQYIKKQNSDEASINSVAFSRPTAPTLGADKKVESLAKPIVTQTTSLTRDGKKRIQPIFLAG